MVVQDACILEKARILEFLKKLPVSSTFFAICVKSLFWPARCASGLDMESGTCLLSWTKISHVMVWFCAQHYVSTFPGLKCLLASACCPFSGQFLPVRSPFLGAAAPDSWKMLFILLRYGWEATRRDVQPSAKLSVFYLPPFLWKVFVTQQLFCVGNIAPSLASLSRCVEADDLAMVSLCFNVLNDR